MTKAILSTVLMLAVILFSLISSAGPARACQSWECDDYYGDFWDSGGASEYCAAC